MPPIFLRLSGDQGNLCDNGVIPVFCLIKNSVSCTEEYANLDSLLNIIQYQYWDRSDTHFYLPKRLFSFIYGYQCNSTWWSKAKYFFYLPELSSCDTAYSGGGLRKTYFASAIFSFCLHLPTLRYGFAQFQAFEELTNYISRTDQKGTRMQQR